VKNGQVYPVTYEIWLTNGVLANEQAMDEFVTLLTQGN